jgi:ATP/maltotriose-dependent transcriptional regulator MalT
MAERSFQEAVTIDAEAYLSSIYSSPPILLAHLYWRRQRPTLAWKIFAPILRRCELENTPGIILQEGALALPLLKLANTHQTDVAYAEKLLAVLETDPPPGASRGRPAINAAETALASPLTEREREVLDLLAQGASNQTIAAALVISLPTVKSHISHILSKLHASSRGEAVAIARQRGLV